MNWDRLANHPDFLELFSEGGEAAEELGRLERRLISGNETDAHNVGHLRGRIAGIRWVFDYVQRRSEENLRDEEEPPAKGKSKLSALFHRPIN